MAVALYEQIPDCCAGPERGIAQCGFWLTVTECLILDCSNAASSLSKFCVVWLVIGVGDEVYDHVS